MERGKLLHRLLVEDIAQVVEDVVVTIGRAHFVIDVDDGSCQLLFFVISTTQKKKKKK